MAKDVIARLKADTSDFDSKFKQSGRALEQFKQQGINVDGMLKQGITSLAKYATAGAALTAALKVASDAFFKNEQSLDEWGRVVESSQALYDGFLTALNTGDISGYLGRMDQIVNAARDAYDAMDALGTFKAFNQRNELIGRNNLQNAINNYREGKGSKEDVQKAGEAYIKELQKRQTLESSNYAAQIRKIAAEKGVDAKELTRLLTGDYASYQKAASVQMTGKKVEFMGGQNFGSGQTITTAYATNAEEKMGEALRMFNDTALQEIQRIGTEEIQTSLEIESVRKQMSRAMGKATTAGTGSSKAKITIAKETYTPVEGSIDAMKAKIADLERQFNATADDAIRGDLKTAIEECNAELDKMTGKAAEAAAKAAKAVEEANAKRQERSASLTSGFNSSVQGIVNPTASIGDQYKGKSSKEEDFQRLVQQYDQLAATIAKAKEQNADGAIVDPSAILAAETELDNLRSKIEEIGPAIQANMNFQSMLDSVSQVQSVFGSISSVANGIKSIGSEWDNVSNAGEGFLATINTITTALGIFNTVMTTVNTIQQLMTGTTLALTAAKTADSTASAIAIGAKTGEAIADSAVVAALKLETSAHLANASAQYFDMYAWIPFIGPAIAAGFTSLAIATVQTAKIAGAFAEGGEVKGGAFAGDAVPIMANAGEVVLSASMQQNLASNLTNNGGGGGTATTTIKGEQLITVINNTRKRKGKGEIL